MLFSAKARFTATDAIFNFNSFPFLSTGIIGQPHDETCQFLQTGVQIIKHHQN